MDISNQNSKPTRLQKSGSKLALMLGGGLFVLLLAGYLALCGVAASKSDRVLPNTTVAGIAVGGMTQSEVASTLQEAQKSWSTQQDAYLLFGVEGGGSETLTVQVPANYLALDDAATAERVWEEGSLQGNVLLQGAQYLRSLLGEQSIAPIYVDAGNLDLLLAEDIDGRIGNMTEESTATIVGDQLELTRGTPGLEPDKEQIKKQLFELLSKGETVSATEQTPQFMVPLVETQPKELDLRAIHEELCVAPQDASINQATGEFKMEVIGVSFDVAAAETAFSGLAAGQSCRIPVTLTQPKVKMADLQQYLFKDLLGACTTKIGGTSNRLSNVKLAASFCNEKILSPGEDFSYNGTVGRRTSARGFKPAPAYVAGETVEEIGGGICQVSSTIYLASLRANMGIVERHNHGYTVGYVPDGLDATVYSGSLDFRFRNTSKYPIKIVASVTDRTLNISIYGTKTDAKTVEMKTEKLSSTPYKTVYKIDDSVAPGKTKTSVTPYTGCTVKAYRNIYENGTLVSSKLESTSVYKSRDKVILVNSADAYKYGLGEKPKPDPTPTPTPTPNPTPNPNPTPTPTPEPNPNPTPTPEPTPEPKPTPTPTPEPTPTPSPEPAVPSSTEPDAQI